MGSEKIAKRLRDLADKVEAENITAVVVVWSGDVIVQTDMINLPTGGSYDSAISACRIFEQLLVGTSLLEYKLARRLNLLQQHMVCPTNEKEIDDFEKKWG